MTAIVAESHERFAEPQVADAGRYDAFISYAREDGAVVERLRAELERQGKQVWIDVKGIIAGEDWEARIKRAIEACKAFVFVLSPDSVSSKPCRHELDQAAALKKLIIPVYRREFDKKELPAELAERQWIFLREGDPFQASIGGLVEALETDLEWRDRHTRLAGRTREWLDAGRDRSFLLRGSDLRDAEEWVATQADHKQKATDEQAQYIVESRRAVTRRQRLTLGAVAGGFVITVALALLAWWQRQQAVERARVASSRELAATSLAMTDRDAELSVLLAVEASRQAPTEQAEDALRRGLLRWPARRALRHRTEVEGAEYSPDGRFILTASRDAVRLIDAGSGRLVRRYPVDERDVVSAQFSTDGRYVVTATDRGAMVVDATSGQVVRRLSTEGDVVEGAKFSRSGRRVIVPTQYGARVFDVRTGRVLAKLAHGSLTYDAELSSRGDLAVTFGPNRTVRVWRASTGRAVADLRHGVPIVAANLSPNGRLLVTSTLDNIATVWRLPAGRPIAKLQHFSGVKGASFSPDGSLLFTNGGKLWDTRARRTVAELRHASSVVTSAFSSDGQRLATGDEDGVARVWDLTSRRVVNRLSRHASRVSAVSFSPDARFVLTASPDRTVRVWEAAPGSSALKLRKDGEAIHEAKFGPDGRTVVVASDRGAVQLWDADTGGSEGSLKGPGGAVSSVSLSRDGRLLIAGGDAGIARLWRVGDRRPLATLKGHQGAIIDVSVSPNDKYAVTAADDGTVRLWNPWTGRELGRLGPFGKLVAGADFAAGGQRIVANFEGVLLARSPSANVITAFPHSHSGAVSPDGNTLAISDLDGITLRRADNGRKLRQLPRSSSVFPEGFASSGRFLAGLVLPSRAASVWDLRSGRRVFHIREPAVSALTIRPGDGFVAAGGYDDGLVRIYELISGERVATFGKRGRGRPTSVEFSADGRLLLAREEGRGVWIYRCEVCNSQRELVDLARERAIRPFSAEEMRRYLHKEPE